GLMIQPRGRSYEGIIQTKNMVLNAYNFETKYNGYYSVRLGEGIDPKLLLMDACSFQPVDGIMVESSMEPIKARDTDRWLVLKESDKLAPNYFTTSDFKNYKQITHFAPQKNYNWYTKELHRYKGLDGTLCEGVLIKPENFDLKRKYPVVIIFYNKFANNLYTFPGPDYNRTSVMFGFKPGWLESHGYLVFLPNMYETSLRVGPGALNTIEGAINYLKNLPFVDDNAIAGCAHSASAKMGSYVFTHSNSLAAMAISEGAAFANPINLVLSNYDDDGAIGLAGGESLHGNLWQNKAVWIDHTTVLNVDTVASPLLLFAGRKDPPSRIDQTFQLFTALRRLEKKTWWLEYDLGAHNVDWYEAMDYTIRFTQYFDHDLKHAPAPRWMTQGLPFALKGVESRLELDAAGSCALVPQFPKIKTKDSMAQYKNSHCYVCEAWNKQYNRNPSLFEKEIKNWKLDKDIEAEMDRKLTDERTRLDREQKVRDREIVNILTYGYQKDNKRRKNRIGE
ncbi:MAG TPA: hypothetical protein VFI06_13315, partial [Chitinophagaceae bacterium]|nr:hypothetical protein [Chitinophagaceae bacterium]